MWTCIHSIHSNVSFWLFHSCSILCNIGLFYLSFLFKRIQCEYGPQDFRIILKEILDDMAPKKKSYTKEFKSVPNRYGSGHTVKRNSQTQWGASIE